MQPIVIPEFPRLRGEKAIKALHNFINELEEHRGKELTDKQITALIRLARELISVIEAENRPSTSDKEIKERRFVTQVKKNNYEIHSRIIPCPEDGKLWKLTRRGAPLK